MRKFVFLFIYLFILSCGNQNEKGVIQGSEEAFLTSHETILLDSDFNSELGYLTWKPNKEGIKSVRKTVQTAIADGKFNRLNETARTNIESYFYFQYVPYTDDKGQRVIFINAFCDLLGETKPMIVIDNETGTEHELSWKDYFIEVSDGGWCYWQMEVNIDTGEYFNLHFNGIG